jgi:hypothetical protein
LKALERAKPADFAFFECFPPPLLDRLMTTEAFSNLFTPDIEGRPPLSEKLVSSRFTLRMMCLRVLLCV